MDAWLDDAVHALRTGAYAQAAAAAHRVLDRRADHPLALLILGVSQHRLGAAEALTTLQRAVTLAPADAQFHYNYAVILAERDQPELAMVEYRACLDRDPDFRDALWNYGELLRLREHFTHALACFDRLLKLEGVRRGKLAHRMAVCCAHIPGLEARAESLFRDQIATDDDPHSHWEYAHFLLAQGRDADAWPHYARRFEAGHRISVRRIELGYPAWRGDYPRGTSLLVHGEQGAGDEILFAAYIPELLSRAQAAGMAVVLACRPALARLFAASFPGAEVLAFDPRQPQMLARGLRAHRSVRAIAIGDLPLHLPKLAPTAYLQPHIDDVMRMRPLVADTAAGIRKVGLVWQANPAVSAANRVARNLPPRLLNDYAAGLDSVRWFSLQTDEHRAALADLVDLPITDCSHLLGDFSCTAALMREMDCVISVCTASANLAGALGCDTKVLLQKHADWRWHSDTAWYPRARTFRQTVAGNWSDPLRRLFKASDPFTTRGHSP